jgi:Zn-dependent M28 family amino/carboxypeptidase
MQLRTMSSLFVLSAAAACAGSPLPAPIPADRVERLLGILAADSMEGRQAGSRGYAKAAAFVAAEMQRIGLVPAGDSGFFQRVPARRNAAGRMSLMPSVAALDTIPAAERLVDVNVVGIIPGGDESLQSEVVVVGAHLDHIGVAGRVGAGCRALGADSICNGADDDASGVVAVLEAARALKSGRPPKRTLVFIAFTGEEGGPSGSRWYIDHPVRPITNTVAQLQVEMIARADSLVGGAGKAWLTGYERSTMGDSMAAAGIPVVLDPRPAQSFFTRSDNIRFARIGIPAHTFSTYNMHSDYHRAGDEASKADYPHMAAVIDAAARAVRLLADGPRPQWKPGGKPEPAPAPRPRPSP